MAQTPTERTPVPVLLRLSAFHDEGLARYTDAEHTPLRERNRVSTEQLQAAYDAYRAQVTALARPRARVVHADRDADSEVDLFDLAVKTADGGKPGTLYAALLPQGKTVIVEPVGPSGLDQLRQLIGRLEASATPLATEWVPRLTAVHDRYETALADRKSARERAAVLRAELAEARRIWVASYVRNQGGLKQIYGKDKRRFEAFFDRFRANSRKGEDVVADDDDGEDGGGGPTS